LPGSPLPGFSEPTPTTKCNKIDRKYPNRGTSQFAIRQKGKATGSGKKTRASNQTIREVKQKTSSTQTTCSDSAGGASGRSCKLSSCKAPCMHRNEPVRHCPERENASKTRAALPFDSFEDASPGLTRVRQRWGNPLVSLNPNPLGGLNLRDS